MRKYELTEDRHPVFHGLRRIRAVRNIPEAGVREGDLGGWIESERNLAHDGACWVSVDAMVAGDAVVVGDAQVSGGAIVFGSALVAGEARVSGNAMVSGKVQVYGESRVFGEARVFGRTLVFGNAQVSGRAVVLGSARVFGSASVSGDCWVADEARVSGSAVVTGEALVYGEARVYGNAHVSGEALVCGDAHVSGSARVNGSAVVTGEEPALPDYPGAAVHSSDGRRVAVRSGDRGGDSVLWLTTAASVPWKTESQLLEWLGPDWWETTTPPVSEWVPVDFDQIRDGDFARVEWQGAAVEGVAAVDGHEIEFKLSVIHAKHGQWFKRKEQDDA